jgi:hypothetical protein
VALPRGCVSEAEQLLAEHGVKLAVEDPRHDGAPLELKFDGELTLVQKEGGGPQIGGGKRKPNGRVALRLPLVRKTRSTTWSPATAMSSLRA